jgi:signal transduction histidine kinase/EAL domain-containing protein (putative c-di-GMP-specific phosphodiesterase class I)
MTYSAEDQQALRAYLRFVGSQHEPNALWDSQLEHRAITEDAWPVFLGSLRAAARDHAKEGLPFGDWVKRANRRRDDILAMLRSHPEAAEITRGLFLLQDLVIETMARNYFEAKERMIEEGRLALRRSEEQLQQAQKMDAIGKLAGGVAHDFNNIITVVESYAQMLEESLDAADERRTDASEIRKAAERATRLTRQLLTLSRQSPIAPRSIDPDELVRGFSNTIRRLLGNTIKLEFELAHPPTVVADPGQLEQVLMNLVVNARDAMDGKGRVVIETSLVDVQGELATSRGVTAGRYSAISVTDNGPGIPAEIQARIFDPFFTTKEAGKGTGLGLAIVHGIVTQAGGMIDLYSEPGQGSTFRILLPAASRTHIATGEMVPFTSQPLRPVTVLCVDAQREVRELIARVLGSHGCRVLPAASGVEARAVCVEHEGTIDVALVDIALPDGRGDLMLRDLRELRPELRVVLTSGFPAGSLHAPGEPVMLLHKPFTPGRLRDAVAAVTAEHTTPATRRSESNLMPRVLLVDDDPSLRKMMSRFLKRSAFEVVEADCGRVALQEVAARRFDVILSDIHMPDGSGLDLLRGVRRVDLDVPVILISGKPDVETAAKALEFGAFRYLSKPLELEAIERIVRTAVRAHALARIRREASTLGRGRHNTIADRAGLEVRFDSALESMWMAYQPIIDARTQQRFGVEALMRTREVSLSSPPAVIDAAGQLERLPQLGRRIRNLVGGLLDARADVPSVFVNLHPTDIFDVHLIDEAAPLTRHASRVVLEVTERESLTSTPALTERLERLRSLGFRIAVDDIGAGYSGLTSFTDLMPEIVKIDMSLVRSIHTSKVKERTVAALCSLCHDMGTLVVGEGVETSDERDCLLSVGCDLLQGYLFGKPAAEVP